MAKPSSTTARSAASGDPSRFAHLSDCSGMCCGREGCINHTAAHTATLRLSTWWRRHSAGREPALPGAACVPLLSAETRLALPKENLQSLSWATQLTSVCAARFCFTRAIPAGLHATCPSDTRSTQGMPESPRLLLPSRRTLLSERAWKRCL